MRTERRPRTARCLPADLGGLDGDDPARTFIEMQDRKIGEVSGMARGRIKTMVRSKRRVA